MKKKIIIIAIIILVAAGFLVYWFFIKNGKQEFALEKVSYGTVVKEVSETGAVKISEEVNLSFKNTGTIEKIYIKVGDEVLAGQLLAKLDSQQLYIEIQKAQAALEVAKADYQKLLAGSSAEEIKVSQADVLNAQVTLDNTKQSLKDIEADAKEDLDQAYEDALDALDETYLKIYNAFNVVSDIEKTYFTSNDQESVRVKESKNKIQNAQNQAKFYITEAKNSSENEKIDTAILKVKDALSNVKESLEVVRDMAETSNYQNTVSSSNKTSLDNQKSYINTANTNVISVQQTISATKITNEKNINSAKADVALTEAKLQKAKDELALKQAGPTQENIDLYQAKIKQAEAEVLLLGSQIQDSILKSPTNGQIVKISKREGETVQPTDPVISLLPKGEFQVEVDIYEEDIVEVKIGNLAKITLPAFPNEILQGEVIAIDPAEKVIDGIVYYEVNINFKDVKEGIKPGMTADIVIETDKKENVLIIPKGALKEINGEKIVTVFKNKKTEERKIEIGLEGDDSLEVLSGLSEGEEIIIGEK